MSTNNKVVYEVRRGDNHSHVFYVGQGLEVRTRKVYKCCRTKEFMEEVENHGYIMKIVAKGLYPKDSKEMEKMLILKYGRIDLKTGTLVNQSSGGEVTPMEGKNHHEGSKTKMRTSQIGKMSTQEARDNISRANTGRVISAEGRANMSKAQMGLKNSLGYKHTDEWKKLASIRHKGKTMSDEAKAKISAANKGHITSEKQKAQRKAAVAHSLDCHHCNQTVKYMTYIRYHGNNCKSYV